MSALDHSGSADNFQHSNEQITQAQLSPENYQAGRENRQPQGNEAFEDIPSTVSGKRLEVQTVAASTLGAFAIIVGRNEPITPAGLKNVVCLMELDKETRGAHGLPNDQSTIPPEALARFGGFLTLQGANHPFPGAREAIAEVVKRYFTPAQA